MIKNNYLIIKDKEIKIKQFKEENKRKQFNYFRLFMNY